MDLPREESGKIRFLSFTNDEEDAEKTLKLKEAAKKIEQAIANNKNSEELIDYVPPPEIEEQFDPAKDTRSLYERLQEQRDKKKEEIESCQKLSNLISKLDEDEASYLNDVAKNYRDEEAKKRLEAYDILEEKKRIEADKIEENEMKAKLSLISRTTKVDPKTSILKSHLLSKIRVKPKLKTCDGSTSAEK